MGSQKKELRVGMIGYGMMGVVHSRAYRALALHAGTEVVPVLDGNRIEINGEKGSIRWNMMRLNELEVFFTEDEPSNWGFRTITSTRDKNHPFAENYWVSIGYQDLFTNLFSDLAKGIAKGESLSPNFEDGLRNQQILNAVEASVIAGQWKEVHK